MPELPQGSGEGTFNNYQKYITKGGQKNNKTKLIGLLAIVLLVVAIPVTIVVNKFTQETRQRAATESFNLAAYTSCGNAPADIVLIMDRSGSMKNTLGTSTITKINAAKTINTISHFHVKNIFQSLR